MNCKQPESIHYTLRGDQTHCYEKHIVLFFCTWSHLDITYLSVNEVPLSTAYFSWEYLYIVTLLLWLFMPIKLWRERTQIFYFSHHRSSPRDGQRGKPHIPSCAVPTSLQQNLFSQVKPVGAVMQQRSVCRAADGVCTQQQSW